MAERVTSPELRFKLVEKTVEEVGDGTPFPMLATPGQVAELMYRVTKFQWVSGTAEARLYYAFGGGDYIANAVQFNAASQSGALVEAETQNAFPSFDGAYTRKGYCTVMNGETPDLPMSNYGSSYFAETYYLSFIADGGIGPNYYYAIREAVSERTMLADAFLEPNNATVGHFRIGSEAFGGFSETMPEFLFQAPLDTFRTGFSYFGTSFTSSGIEPIIHAPFNTYFDSAVGGSPVPSAVASVDLQFTGDVAWVDVNGSGNPLDPLNQLYIGVRLSIVTGQSYILGGAGISFSTDRTALVAWSANTDTGYLLKLKLSGGTYLTAKIYGQDAPIDPSFDSYGYGAVTDWEMEAIEWRPSAKANPSVPVWDTASGVKL